LFIHYQKQVARFCDVMADLDLYHIMLKCVEFFNKPDGDESENGTEELTIFVRRYQEKKTQQSDTGQQEMKTIKVDVEENETIATVSSLVLEELGFPTGGNSNDSKKKLTIRYGNDIVIENTTKTTLRDLGIEDGDVLTIEQQCIAITIRRKTTTEGKPIKGSSKKDEIKILIEPMATLKELKIKIAESLSEHTDNNKPGDTDDGSEENIQDVVDDQILYLVPPNKGNNNKNIELSDNDKSCTDYCIIMGSVLNLEFAVKAEPAAAAIKDDDEPIIIVDTKYGTMFSVNRAAAITKGVVTPVAINDNLVFQEITTKTNDIERLKKSMLESPNLKVKPALVIEKMKIEDYEIDGAKDVKNMWGVQLKKTSKTKRGTEIFFVDLHTKSIGLLDRKKLLDMEFITVVQITDNNNKLLETLEEGEKDQQKYDYYVRGIRTIFGIAYAMH
jgi:hypothetical protein